MGKFDRSVLLVSTALSLGTAAPVYADMASDVGTQVAQANESRQIEEITVTARRTTERLQDVPISITVFSQQDLSNHDVVNASDLAKYTPSLQVNSLFGGQNTSFSIRGFVQDLGTLPSVGVYFADVVEPNGNLGQTNGNGAGPGDFFDLTNVQVLKGPQGTLFGRNTTGGNILLVPKKPTDEFGGYVQGTFGNYNTKGTQGVINIPVTDKIRLRFGVDHLSRDGYLHNTSGIGPDNFDDVNYTAVRASADIDITPDIENYTIASYSNSSTNGDVQKMIACDAHPSSGAAGAALFVSLLGACNQLNPAKPTFQGSGFYDVAQSDTNPSSKLVTWRIINTTTWHESDNLTVKNIASYAQLNDKLASPIFGTNFFTPALPAIPHFILNPVPAFSVPFANSTPIAGGSTANTATYTEEFQLQGKNFDNRLNWQAGLYLEGAVPVAAVGVQSPDLLFCSNSATFQCSDPVGMLASAGAGVPIHIGSILFSSGTFNYNDYAAYAQATYKLTDEFKVTGGIRFTEDRQANTTQEENIKFNFPFNPLAGFAPLPVGVFATQCTNPLGNLATCTESVLQKSRAPTWLLDLDYTPTDNILAYAKYSRGYRAGVINSLLVPPYNKAGPERVDTYEAGLKTSFQGIVSGTFNVDGFYNDFSDQQLLISFPTNPCVLTGTCPGTPSLAQAAVPVNAGTSHIYGAELDSTIVPYKDVTLHVTYTYLTTELTAVHTLTPLAPNSPFILGATPQVGEQLPLSPHNKVSFTSSYKLPVDENIGAITLAATFTHTDSQITNFTDNAAALPPPKGLGPSGSIFSGLNKIQPTNLLDLNLNWDNIGGYPLDLLLFATNVTGEKYYTYISGLGPNTGFETAAIGEPTFYGARLTIHFGND